MYNDVTEGQDEIYGRSPAELRGGTEESLYNNSPDRPGEREGQRVEGAEVPSAPRATLERSRTQRLAKFLGVERSAESRRKAFEAKAMPAREAPEKEKRAYLQSAQKAGLTIREDELDSILHSVSQAGKANVISRFLHGGSALNPGETILGQILAKQNPELAERVRFEDRGNYDAREAIRPEPFKDLELDTVFQDKGRLDAAMSRLGAMKPLSEKSTFKQFDAVQKAFRSVGVRLTVEDFESYKDSLKEGGVKALLRPGADDSKASLAGKMLIDMNRKPADRYLVGTPSRFWVGPLERYKQIPAAPSDGPLLPSNLIDRTQEAHVVDSDVAQALRPENNYVDRLPTLEEVEGEAAELEGAAVESGPREAPDVERQAPDAEREAPKVGMEAPQGVETRSRTGSETPYGVKIPAGPTMVRDGVARPIPQGYRQEGRIVAIDEVEGSVFQATRSVNGLAGKGIETVRYDLADLEEAIPRGHLQQAMKDGHTMRVSMHAGKVEVEDLALNQALEQQMKTLEAPTR